MRGTITSTGLAATPEVGSDGRTVLARSITVTVAIPVDAIPAGVELLGRPVELYLPGLDTDPGPPADAVDEWRTRLAEAEDVLHRLMGDVDRSRSGASDVAQQRKAVELIRQQVARMEAHRRDAMARRRGGATPKEGEGDA